MAQNTDVQAVEREIEQAHAAWMAAAVRGDQEVCEQHVANEFTMVVRGTEFGRAQWMRNLQSGRELEPIQRFAQRVLVYGDAAMMTQRTIRHYILDGIERTVESYVTDIWVRRDGRWQVVRRHTAPVSPGAS